MGPEVINRNKNNIFHGNYAGRDLNVTNIIMQEESEREFVVTHNANIKPVAYFTGRERELEDLRQRIEEKRKSVLVSGMGGIGKTHICRKLFEEYSNRHAEDGNGPFRHIGYVEYDGNMDTSLQRCLKYKEQDSPEKNREAAWRELEYLASDGKLLLFVDNVDKTMKEDPGLQRLNGIPGVVILTSRQASVSDEFESYRIGFLGIEQCKEIYEKIRFEDSGGNIKPEEVQDLEYVIEKLAGRHTITIELLAHMARTKLWTAKRLMEELEEKGFQLQFRKNGELINIQKSYEVLYDLSKLTGAEQNILEAFSVFPYIPLAAETCNEWLLADAGVNEEDDILNGLYQKGWLQFEMEYESYCMHPVFAQVIHRKCKPEYGTHSELIEACRKSIEIFQGCVVIECLPYIPFAENVIAELVVGNDFEQISFIADTAYLLFYVAEFKKARFLYEMLLTIIENELGEEHPSIATIYNNLAIVYEIQGEYKKAKEMFEKSLRMKERVAEEMCSEIAISYNNMAIMYKDWGKYKKAKELYEKSLGISERELGEEHLTTTTIYNNLAILYENMGEYSKAEELYEKSLRIKKRVLGEEHPDTAKVYNNMAIVYWRLEEYRKAEKLYEKSLQIREKILGKGHPDTAVSNYCLGLLCRSKGEYKKALSYCLKAYKTLVYRLGRTNPNTQELKI